MTEIRAVSVFCGSRFGADSRHREAAARLGRLVAERRMALVYGGGAVGLMGVLAEAALAAGGRVVGVIPRFLVGGELAKRDLSELVIVGSMHERKTRMFELSDGCVVLPGGLGTLDEAIEIVTWRQLRLHAKPVVFVNIGGYWDPLKALVASIVDAGFAGAGVADLFRMVDDVAQVFSHLVPAREPSRGIADRL